MKNLKPVIFLEGKVNHYRENTYAQNLILKALSQGITDVDELKKIAGLKTAAEVFRTLDKMQIRKGYHEALSKAGMDLDYIVDGLKKLIDTSDSDKIKLGSLQTVLKSVGLDKYEKQEDAGKNWEELIIELSEKNEGKVTDMIDAKEYEVKTPLLPESAKKRQEDEKRIAKELYEG